MITKHTYFGIKFSEDSPLNSKTKRQIAKLLLLNPDISVDETYHILNNHRMWSKIHPLIERLQCEPTRIIIQNQKSYEENSDEKHFFLKLFQWVKEFSFPTIDEVNEIAILLDIPENYITVEFYLMLFSGEMPPAKIFDYLEKYSSELTKHLIDELLDLYTLKVQEGILCYPS